MIGWMPTAVYSLCLATSVVCAALLLRAYRASRSKLLLYTALGFGFLAVNNLFLVADLVLLPNVDLWAWRQAASLAAVAVLLYGFTFEVES
jgi:predicted Kef-type K+ transport protein